MSSMPENTEEAYPFDEAKDALTLIKECAEDPSIDVLAARARCVLALEAPSAGDLLTLTQYWRADRASWGNGKKESE